MTNEGWADSVKKILGSSKPKNKKTLVLSRAKKFSETIKTEKEEKPAFEIVGDGKSEEDKTAAKKEIPASAEPPVKKKVMIFLDTFLNNFLQTSAIPKTFHRNLY